MHYIIDGYNLIFNSLNKSCDLQESRKEVLNNLSAVFSKLEQEVTIVFDGKGPDLSFESFKMIQIIFTPQKTSADDYILEIIANSLHPTQIIVVSSDKSLIQQCKYYGSNAMSIKQFLKFLKSKFLKKPKNEDFVFQDSKQNIERLNKIFEKKLKKS